MESAPPLTPTPCRNPRREKPEPDFLASGSLLKLTGCPFVGWSMKYYRISAPLGYGTPHVAPKGIVSLYMKAIAVSVLLAGSTPVPSLNRTPRNQNPCRFASNSLFVLRKPASNRTCVNSRRVTEDRRASPYSTSAGHFNYARRGNQHHVPNFRSRRSGQDRLRSRDQRCRTGWTPKRETPGINQHKISGVYTGDADGTYWLRTIICSFSMR